MKGDVAPCGHQPTHGLYIDYEKYHIAPKSDLGRLLAKSRAALLALFPGEVNAAANLLINRIVYKAIKLELFERLDYTKGDAAPTAVQHYLNISNSLRGDLNTLVAMSKEATPMAKVPTLQEYLGALKSGTILPVEGGAGEEND